MKKLLLSILALMAMASLWAQTVQLGPQSNKFDQPTILNAKVLGKVGSNYVMASNDFTRLGLAYMIQNVKVYLFDESFTPTRSIEVVNTKGYDILEANLKNNKVYLLLADRGLGKTQGIYTAVVDLTATQVSPQEQVVVESDKRNRFYISSQPSPNGTFYAVRIAYLGKESDGSRVLLLDNEMNLRWEKEFDQIIDDVMPTDDGMIYGATFTTNDDGDSQVSIIAMKGSEVKRSQFIRQGTKLYDIHILKADNDHLLLGGTWTSPLAKRKRIEIGGFYGLLLDLPSYNIANFDKQNLSHADFVNYFNLKPSMKAKETDFSLPAADFSFDGCLHTSHAHMLSYARRWIIERTDNMGNMQVTAYSGGSISFAVADDGSVSWHHSFRNSATENNCDRHLMGCRFTDGDNFVLLQSEHRKNNPSSNDAIVKQVKCAPLLGNTPCTAIYTVSPDGSLSKTTFDQNIDAWVMPAHFALPDGNTLFFLTKEGTSNMATFSR